MFDNVMNHRALCVDPTVRWQATELLAAQMEPSVAQTLLDPESLTQRLTEVAKGQFGVIPLHECEAHLLDIECQALGLLAGSRGWVREIYLTGLGVPWVFARTVIPEQVQEHGGLDFRTLGNQSIGPWLFGKLNFQRGAMQFCHYENSTRNDQSTAAPWWMRRSCFERGDLGILVSEVFLPTYWDVVSAKTTVAA